MKRKIKLGNNMSTEFEDDKIKIYESVLDWRAEGEKRFGEDVAKWKFKCPMCGHVASVQDFRDVGLGDFPNAAYAECIGRYIGKGAPKKGDSSGCNWVSHGLFGIPNEKGAIVITGGEIQIFDFAEEGE